MPLAPTPVLGEAEVRTALETTARMVAAAEQADWNLVETLRAERDAQLSPPLYGNGPPATAQTLAALIAANAEVERLARAERSDLARRASGLRHGARATLAYGMAGRTA